MGYNNYFPQTYTSPTYVYGATAAPAQTWTTPAQSTSQQVNAINWVQGEAGAKSVPVAPGQKVLLMDSWENQEALDNHHNSETMKKIMELRNKYDLHMVVEKYIKDETNMEGNEKFIRK